MLQHNRHAPSRRRKRPSRRSVRSTKSDERGQVHVFGQCPAVNARSFSRKMDQSPDFAVRLGGASRRLRARAVGGILWYHGAYGFRRATDSSHSPHLGLDHSAAPAARGRGVLCQGFKGFLLTRGMRITISDNGWLLRSAPATGQRLRLFCLPHAGGNATAFRGWTRLAKAGIEVCVVQYPGHGHRIREPLLQDFDTLLRQTGEALAAEMDVPFAFFGHSLGALLAFELARQRNAQGEAEPQVLIVSGHNGPLWPRSFDEAWKLEDDELVDMLRRMQYTPEALLANRELMDLMLPVLRADLAVYDGYACRPGPPLRCPLCVFGGRDDPHTDAAGLEAWRRHAAGIFDIRWFPGDHFYLFANEQIMMDEVGRILSGQLSCGGQAKRCQEPFSDLP